MSGAARRPGCGALAVVVRADKVLLVQRANPPDQGLWGFPGGRIEWGETAADAAVRELREETGVEALAGAPFCALDALDRGAQGEVLHHYVLVAVLCHWRNGEARAADDALDTRWFDLDEIAARQDELSLRVLDVARQAMAIVARA
ncbi:MAG: hypothetical protein B7Y95_21750 [Rhizobiales bacterium 32-66-11]|jgi:8-oxo-dGTP diphosphatase|nr:MAG: hypothetical protein B7Y95_21750 [Rhizobiales bacterium 32-66-11]